MINLKRTIAVATTAGLFALAGISGAQAAEPTTPVFKRVALTPEQKAAFKAAHDAATPEQKAAHEAAKAARQAAIAAAKPAIESARATFKAARDGATTEEAKKAAHDAFKAAIATARAGIPGKPIKRVRP